MARKLIVSNSNFSILSCESLFTAMPCVNLVFLPQEPNSNEVLQSDTRGFNAAFSL